MHELLKEFPVVISVPLQWGDQDAFGHVNNVVYLRWAETARIDYLTRAGIWQRYETDRVGPILASITCDYRRALTYPDEIWVGARVTGIGNSSIRMAHTVVSRSGGDVAAELSTTLVLYDYNRGRSIPVPAEMRSAIAALEEKRLTPPELSRGEARLR